jgi:hypothetical protein
VAAVVAGYAVVQWWDSRTPVAPAIVVRADRSADSQPLWSPGTDGRPTSPVTLSVAAELSLKDHRAPNSQLTPIGLAGPGVSSPGVFPHKLVDTRPQSFDLTGQVACDQVPLPVPATAYTVRLQVASGSERSAVDVALPMAAAALAQRVTYGCSTWLAARDLTVSQAEAVIDTTRPHVQLALTLTNGGRHDGVVWLGSMVGTGIRVNDIVLTVPAHGSARTVLDVNLDTCWTWDASSAPLTTTDTPLPLLGAVGVDGPLSEDSTMAFQGVNGLVLGPGVGAELQDAFVQACGGVARPELSTGVHSSRYVVSTQSLTTTAMVDVPVPQVRQVRFVPVDDPASTGPVLPRYPPSPWLTVDATGRVAWPLAYTTPPNIVCISGAGRVYVSTDVQALVTTTSGASRVVTFRIVAEALLPTPEIRAACDAMDASG